MIGEKQMTREIGFQEVLSSAIDYYTANIYTSMPGIVVSVDMDAMRVEVQPTLNVRNTDGDESFPRPVIINVPLQLPISDKGGLTFPIGNGCPIKLTWTMRGLDKWKRGDGMPDSPSDVRKFDIRDCIATPGIYPLSMSKNAAASRTNPHSPDDVVLVHNIGTGSEVEIRLKPSGEVFINSPVKVTMNAPDTEINGNVKINGNFENSGGNFTVETGSLALSASESAAMLAQINIDGDIILNGESVDSHDHGGVTPGGSRTNPFGA